MMTGVIDKKHFPAPITFNTYFCIVELLHENYSIKQWYIVELSRQYDTLITINDRTRFYILSLWWAPPTTHDFLL